jgi:putative CocE/NonD family hydrolase
MNMSKGTFATTVVLSILTIVPPMASAQQRWPNMPEITTEIRKERSVFVPMRDGVRLSTDLYFPVGVEGKVPVILVRTPYGKEGTYPYGGMIPLLVQQGYIVAIQDARGRYESEGRYRVRYSDRKDGYDTIDWLIRQPWSDGQVATFGCSYLGETQITLAAEKHPNHVAMMPMASAAAYNDAGRPFTSFDGGVLELAQTAGWFMSSGSTVFHGPPAWLDRQEWFQSEQANMFNTGYESPRSLSDSAKLMEIYKTLPIVDMVSQTGMRYTDYEDFVTNTPESDYFDEGDWIRTDDTFDTPALYIDSWYDFGVAESIKMFNQMREHAESEEARENQFIILTPSTHCAWAGATENTVIGERDLGDARKEFVDIYLKWYEHWLKGVDNGITDMPRVQYYLMGLNEWRSAESWPVEGTTYRKYFLTSGGRANSRYGDGALMEAAPTEAASDSFVYDPATPVPTLGGNVCCTGMETGAGGYDQATIEMRNDVLVYTSAPIEDGIEVTGFLEVVLYVSSDAKDTDFTAKLVDVYPDGRAFNLQEGAKRMRFREDLRRKVWMEDGEVYEIHLDLHATSNYFDKGHRVRLEVSSSNFPRWSRNLNTGGNNYDESEGRPANNTVHHSAEHPSHVILPVVND